jgi:hypothetical protein
MSRLTTYSLYSAADISSSSERLDVIVLLESGPFVGGGRRAGDLEFIVPPGCGPFAEVCLGRLGILVLLEFDTVAGGRPGGLDGSGGPPAACPIALSAILPLFLAASSSNNNTISMLFLQTS